MSTPPWGYPAWVYDLINAVDKHEYEHSHDDKSCLVVELENVPGDVLTAARAVAAYTKGDSAPQPGQTQHAPKDELPDFEVTFVRDAAALAELPVNTVVLDRGNDAWQKGNFENVQGSWHLALRDNLPDTDHELLEHYGPVRVLHRGGGSS